MRDAGASNGTGTPRRRRLEPSLGGRHSFMEAEESGDEVQAEGGATRFWERVGRRVVQPREQARENRARRRDLGAGRTASRDRGLGHFLQSGGGHRGVGVWSSGLFLVDKLSPPLASLPALSSSPCTLTHVLPPIPSAPSFRREVSLWLSGAPPFPPPPGIPSAPGGQDRGRRAQRTVATTTQGGLGTGSSDRRARGGEHSSAVKPRL